MFSKKPGTAKELYKRFVLNNIGREKELITSHMKNSWILGDESFVKAIQKQLSGKEPDTELPLLMGLRKRVEELPLDQIKRIAEKNIKDDPRLCRSISIYLSRKYTQRTLKQIAEFYGNAHYASISHVWRRMERRRKNSDTVGKLLALTEAEIGEVSSVKT